MSPTNTTRNAEIIARVKAGERFAAIAAALGVTKSVVNGVSYRAGLADPQRKVAASSECIKTLNADPEFRQRNETAVKAAKARQLCDRYGLHPEELDDYRAIRRRGVKSSIAALRVIASRKSEAA